MWRLTFKTIFGSLQLSRKNLAAYSLTSKNLTQWFTTAAWDSSQKEQLFHSTHPQKYSTQ